MLPVSVRPRSRSCPAPASAAADSGIFAPCARRGRTIGFFWRPLGIGAAVGNRGGDGSWYGRRCRVLDDARRQSPIASATRRIERDFTRYASSERHNQSINTGAVGLDPPKLISPQTNLTIAVGRDEGNKIARTPSGQELQPHPSETHISASERQLKKS